ncbi:dethiobiotin synthase [Vulgatibacter incomptus]|uniref:ATP-dependent dethiobiotin synthetase BioD n=1 Tax=Vulgatibacter incomptus TaxID=1391653 RepID=A0A0K1PFJ3_9BACT|nr:dethiobiotin synthase [Vulgatibacter incomptus]AKU92285.1 Dethiobiotin synthetase [Vulgatibacter incomptus]
MRGLFVTATDTGVGKTAVACSLVTAMRRRGLDVGAMKPAESGCPRDAAGRLVPADARLLQAAAGGGDPLELVCPYRLEAPLAPGIAAAREGVAIDPAEVERCLRALGDRHADGVVVEGAGGLLVPLDPAFTTMADLAARLSLPVIVVARASLGTINHTALTLEALAARRIPVKGVILSAGRLEDEGAAAENAKAIERLTGAPVLASLPFAKGGSDAERIDFLSAWLDERMAGRKLDPASLLA